ncbi:MAG: hypothetical protein D6719_10185 [Candidatus Dadabacteria bacterium]|nr:MAG: hypothetical protein D6719_10185 [Candidatus Dadabacteria bacterium]
MVFSLPDFVLAGPVLPPSLKIKQNGITQDAGNAFVDMYYGKLAASQRSPGSIGTSAWGQDAFDRNTSSSILTDPNSWCEENATTAGFGDDIEKCVEDRKQKLNKWKPTKTTPGHVTIFAPLAGINDTLEWAHSGTQLSNAVASKLSILNVTWLLTEPAVANGISNAIGQANDIVANRYRAEQTFIEQAKTLPAFRDEILSAYRACVFNYLNHKIDIANNSNNRVPNYRVWVAAQSKCLGDRVNNRKIHELFLADATQDVSGTVFELGDDPNHIRSIAEIDSTERNHRNNKLVQTIKLTDYLFNQKAKNLWVTVSTDPIESNKSLKRLRTSFNLTFGDLEYTLTPQCLIDQLGQTAKDAYKKTGYCPAAALNPQILTPVIKVIPPGPPKNWAKSLPNWLDASKLDPISPATSTLDPTRTYGPTFFLRHMTRQIYVRIHDGLKHLCYFRNGYYWDDNSNSYKPLPAEAKDLYKWTEAGNTGAASGDFWSDPTFWPALTQMSMEGFQMTPGVFEAIYSYFTDEQNSNEDELDCEQLNAHEGGASAIDTIMRSQSAGSQCSGTTCLEKILKPRHIIITNLAAKLALGQLLGAAKIALQNTHRLIRGNATPFTKEQVDGLIFSSFGMSNMQELLALEAANIQATRNLIKSVFDKRTSEIGSTGLFTTVFGKGKSSGYTTGRLAS